ncbi:MAG: Gfo/Idh/MocA family oxidoreductase [Spirochaetes bacterium]|nr:Gfo/Idh/MocA family oxidoreductase [Spirochaetota bacterium]
MKTALIGCGRIGFMLESDPLRYSPCTHYGGMIAAGIAVTHACDINQKRLDAFSRVAGIPKERCYTSSDELLQRVQPDLAIIATWTESHDLIAAEAARRGARVIVLEKPIAPSLRKARAILDTCKASRTALIINHERRYDSRYRALKRSIGTGKIGVVRSVHASILTGGYRGVSSLDEGGGPLLHDGTHLVDILRYLFGDFSSVQGEFTRDARSAGYEDGAAAWCRMEGGINVFLEAGGGMRYFVFELEISGTEGKLVIGNGYERLFVRKRSRLYSGFHDLAERRFATGRRNNCFTELYREVKSLMYRRGTAITSSGIDGYRALEAVHAIYLSSSRGAARVSIPVPPDDIDLNEIFLLDQRCPGR